MKNFTFNNLFEGMFNEDYKYYKGIYLYKNGKLHGICNIFEKYYNIIYVKCYYKNDKREGEYIKYYTSGNIFEMSFYKNDKREGEYIKYYTSGNIFEMSFYKNDKREGKCILYYENGNIKL
jgi:antitoxin component YwqK of YwqJK toxin-antitoxin module